VRAFKFTRDGKSLFASFDDGTIRVWNPEQDRASKVISRGSLNTPLWFDIDASGQYVIAGGKPAAVFVFRLNDSPPLQNSL